VSGAAGGEEIIWVSDAEEFAALAAEWDGLLGAEATPFDLHCWYAAWWRAFGDGDELAVCTVRRGGALVAALPLRRAGGGLLAIASSHTPSFRPLARDSEAMTALVAAAVAGRRPFVVECLPLGDPATDALHEGARAGGRLTHLESTYSSPTVATDGDFDAWRTVSKKRWGAPIERFRRKMGRDFEAGFQTVEAPADLEAELREGFRVEASGWKGQAGTAITSRPETERFYTEIAQAFAARDQLRLSRIDLDGRTVAFDFCLLHGGRLYLLKTGFDEEYRKLAPGLVMRLSIIEKCFESGVSSHELLGDASEWKLKFATGTRPHGTLHAFGRGPAGLGRYAYRRNLRPRLRAVYRRLKP
jgi:CelD/BcsL family acetyltransferase involved in cellulose biosynthesis